MTPDSQVAPAEPDAATCWEVLRRVAASPSLKRAVRLREFLEWVGTKSLLEGRTDLHEQEIGHAVFARSEGYDTGQDNIVRVSASELRKRVDAYFAAEGKDEPLIFEIPRGSYIPQFRWRAMAPAPEPAIVSAAPGTPAGVIPPEPAPRRRERLVLVLVASVALLLAVACAVLWQQNRDLRQQLEQPQHPVLAH